MDEKNRNVSDTFGKYNSTHSELKNVSSSMWEPISAGKSTGTSSAPAKEKAASPKKRPPEKTVSGAKKKASGKDKSAGTLISQGRPDKKSRSVAGKPASETAAKKTSSPGKSGSAAAAKKKSAPKKPASRTPKGRDLRKDARENRKHREELFKFRETYQQELKNQRNHDEISHIRNKSKRKKLKIKNALTIGAVLTFALIFIVLYCYSRGALIENVIIEGAHIYSEQEIQQAAGISAGKNMLSLREKKVRRDITKKLPYIKDVTMEYDLPDTLLLTVKETADKYVIATDSGQLTLDSDGKVVSDAKTEIKSGLFCAEGFDYQAFETGDDYEPEGVNAERYRILCEMVTYFEASGIVDTAVITLSNTENVIVTVDGKIAVYFGDCKALDEKVPYASKIIEQVRALGKKGYIDMRYEDGYFKPGSMTIQ